MTTQTFSPFTIVVGLGFTEASNHAFGQAARIASAIPGSHVHVVHVSTKPLDVARRDELVGLLRRFADDEIAAFDRGAHVTVGVHLRSGDPVREIAQLAGDTSASLIVVGAAKRPHVRTWLIGSVAERLLGSAPCAVLVVGPSSAAARRELEIEPPCAECRQTRAQSKGGEWWCNRHRERVVREHVYSYARELPFETHDSQVTPTGIDF